jgi:bifunctional DNA-binding transcriptional regulator/antitoxin component of YhaV-PrlF toxin-antitoxin module
MVMAERELERFPMSRPNRPKKTKRISVSKKRQISIPKEYFDHLNLGEEVTLELYGNHLVLKPLRESFDDFSEEILEELIAEGYSGSDLMTEFRQRKAQLGTAVESLISETARTETVNIDDLFGEDDE